LSRKELGSWNDFDVDSAGDFLNFNSNKIGGTDVKMVMSENII
jgi:hypothetical protein